MVEHTHDSHLHFQWLRLDFDRWFEIRLKGYRPPFSCPLSEVGVRGRGGLGSKPFPPCNLLFPFGRLPAEVAIQEGFAP